MYEDSNILVCHLRYEDTALLERLQDSYTVRSYSWLELMAQAQRYPHHSGSAVRANHEQLLTQHTTLVYHLDDA